MSKATLKLTDEQDRFYRAMLLRVCSNDKIGQPYLSSAFYQLIPVNAPGLKTMGVDKNWRCYIDFDYFMNEKGVEYAASVLNHEPWHLLRSHMLRFEEFDHEYKGVAKKHLLWNYAGDLTINQDIEHLVPKDSLHIGKGDFKDFPRGLLTEEYYRMIVDKIGKDTCLECGSAKSDEEKEKGKDNEKSDGQGEEENQGDGDGQEDGNGQGDADGDSGQDDRSDNPDGQCNGCGKEKPQGKPGQCGTGAGGAPTGYELDEDAEGITEAEAAEIRRQVAEDVRSFVRQRGGNPGTGHNNLKMWADEVLTVATPDWRTLLRASIKSAFAWKNGKMDYNRQRRNRRQVIQGVIMPALAAPQVRVAIGVDTSGSNLGNMGTVAGNVEEIARRAGVRGKNMLAFGVDTKADTPSFVANPKNVLDQLKGGGGTDMCVAFDVFEELGNKKKADIGILLSDLETPWPKEPKRTSNMKYIVCGVMNYDEGSSYAEDIIARAEEALAGWAKLVVIYPKNV